MLRSFALLSAAVILSFVSLVSEANSRLALVFGIDHYDHLPDLANAGNDARAVSAKLDALGFEVMLHEGATRREVYRALDRFESRLADGGGTGMVFFAGHGIQADGRNYLIPADALVEVESDLEAEAINAGRILESMARAGNPLNILVLDACRDNPLPRRTRSANRGLTVTNIPSGAKGTAILYAAGEGQAAQDGPHGGNGVFTESLLDALDKPNLKLEEVIKQITRGVLERTDGYQRPWSLASIQGDFVFNEKEVVPDQPPIAQPVHRQLEEVVKQKEAELKAQLARLQGEAEARLEQERARMAAEFAQTAEQLEEAKRMRKEAEAARIAAESQLAMMSKSGQQKQHPSTIQAAKKPLESIVQSRSYGPHEMVYLKADCYLMGSKMGRIGRGSDESAHQVCVEAFLIDRYEVTFDAYDEFANATGRDLPDDDGMGRAQRPVINIDWDDAWAYAKWASEKYGIKFRLPTEAEWEYACRSGGRDEEYCGSDNPKDVAVFWNDETLPVGSKNPNQFGLYDMSGNAWEITCSPYKSASSFSTTYGDYGGEETTCIKKDHNTGKSLVFRGGSWESDVDEIRARKRRFNAQYTGGGGFAPSWVNELGFRLVADPE